MNAYQPRETQTYGYDNSCVSLDPTGTLIFGYDVSANWFTTFNFEALPGTAVKLRQFTGKERDSESGLDYFGARYYGSGLGRWTSPDWSALPQPIPYAVLAYPQTLNLYSYVRNNPLAHPDIDGHQDPPNGEVETREELERDDAEMAEFGREEKARETAAARAVYMRATTPEQREDLDEAIAHAMDRNLDRHRAEFSEFVKQQESKTTGSNSDPGPYRRPNNATTPEQRASVQGKPCATCGAEGQKNVADHKDALVKQYYRSNGAIDQTQMRSVGEVQPQCSACSNQQGGYLSQFSKAMKKLFGYN